MDGDIGVFLNRGTIPRDAFEFQDETGLLLRYDRNFRILFPTKQGNRPSSPVEEGENVGLLKLWHKTWCSSPVGMGILVDFLSCIKGVNCTFAFQEGTWYSSLDTALEKGLISHLGENLFFLELHWEAWGSSQVVKGTSWTCLCCL